MRWSLLVVCLLAAGCYSRRMNAWMGHPYRELLSAWGAPTTRHALPGGGTVLTWADLQRDRNGEFVSCRRSFTTDSSGTVVDWSLRNCDWRETHIPQPRRR